MPQYYRERSVEERLTVVEEQLARLRRSGRRADELPMNRTNFEGLNYDDTSAAFATVFETTYTPRSATLALGLLLIGDVVGAVNTGGSYQVVINTTDVVASGSVPATFSYVIPSLVLDLSPYLSASDLRVDVQTRRTAGATTGGRYGGGGCIGSTVRYARMI